MNTRSPFVALASLLALLVLAVGVVQISAQDEAPRQREQRERESAERFDAGGFWRDGGDLSGQTTPPENITVLNGFHIERVYEVPFEEQGTWASMTTDDKGRIIASDEARKGLFRLTLPSVDTRLETPQVEKLDVNVSGAQGLLFHQGDLYVVVNGQHMTPGLYRLRGNSTNDSFGDAELLIEVEGAGEHGQHAVILSPEGDSLYLVGGNGTFPKTTIDHSRVPSVWEEDRLQTRVGSSDGPWGENRIGGWVCKTDFDGEHLELFAMGFRNPYDVAFDHRGELLTFDSDMEWDVGTPWYRPTRVNHVISGADFGWRAGTSKWPDTFFDSFGTVFDIGLSSPTGVTFGYGARFPEKYQRALLIADWSLGNIYAVHLQPDGATYTAEVEPFVVGAPLPVTDILVNPKDGAFYFAIGGRGTASAVYRVTSQSPQEPLTEQELANLDDPAGDVRATRQELEQYHAAGNTADVDEIWNHLGSDDRAIRYAARVALEHVPFGDWAGLVASEGNPRVAIAASMALARTGNARAARIVAKKLASIDWNHLSDKDRNDLLRTATVLLSRFARDGEQSDYIREQVQKAVNPHFPTDSERQNRQAAEILSFLETPETIDRILKLLDASPTQESQLHYVLCLGDIEKGWSLPQRRRMFAWFQQAASQRGGFDFTGYLNQIHGRLAEQLSDEERQQLADVLTLPEPSDPYAALENREVVKEWKMTDFSTLDPASLQKADAAHGQDLFRAAMCYRCHRFNGEGGMVGPDLTHVGRRFQLRDVLESIINPSEVISEQYRAVQIITTDGRVLSGKITDLKGNKMVLMNDPLNAADLTMVERDRIEEMRWSPVSTMPTGLMNTFQQQEILDLVAFLMSNAGANPQIGE